VRRRDLRKGPLGLVDLGPVDLGLEGVVAQTDAGARGRDPLELARVRRDGDNRFGFVNRKLMVELPAPVSMMVAPGGHCREMKSWMIFSIGGRNPPWFHVLPPSQE
jgi:hypothetical protein